LLCLYQALSISGFLRLYYINVTFFITNWVSELSSDVLDVFHKASELSIFNLKEFCKLTLVDFVLVSEAISKLGIFEAHLDSI
jgi:hypothetical protein